MFSLQEPPDRDGLALALGTRIEWYRKWSEGSSYRSDGPEPRLHEALPLVLLGRREISNVSFRQILNEDDDGDLWHLQVHLDDLPRYYARARYSEDQWRIFWIGEWWLADPVHLGLLWLDWYDRESFVSNVQLVSSRVYQFTSYWLKELDQHVVVSAGRRLRGRTRSSEEAKSLFRPISGNQLQRWLLSIYGDQFGETGIGAGERFTESRRVLDEGSRHL